MKIIMVLKLNIFVLINLQLDPNPYNNIYYHFDF